MESSVHSVGQLLLERIKATPEREALRYPVPSGWKSLTWKETGERVRALACGLRALGLAPEERAAILSGTCVEWVLADFAILCAAGATTTIYPSNTAEECAYILNDSATRIVFAENANQLAKLKQKRTELSGVKKVILFDGEGDGDWVMSLGDLETLGKQADGEAPSRYEEIIAGVRADSLATLIYTSGTTGQPKGVELTHDCWLYEGEAIDALGLLSDKEVQYLWLPLAHALGKVLELAMIRIGFATAIDGRIDKLTENLAEVKPTFVAAVPRIFEKVHNKVVASAKEGGVVKEKIFRWAFSIGYEVSKRRQKGEQPTGLLALKNALADKLVFSKLRQRFGGQLKFFVSGSAPLSLEMAEFFHAANITILEGYGLTESSAGTFVNVPSLFKFGTVGLALPGTQVKIAPEDGEILIKNRAIMRGYHNLPEATREALTDDGWLRTGDIGSLDSDGYLKITDRKKDLIKTSSGKYVAPQIIEGKLKAICPYVSYVVVHGNNRNFCTALIALEEESLRTWASKNGLAGSYSELTADPKTIALIQPFVDQLNAGLAHWETIKKFALLPADLTQEAGDLTPSLKVKRKVVEQKYRTLLDRFYEKSLVT
jgi:long-chain acyl-CoA synthetase